MKKIYLTAIGLAMVTCAHAQSNAVGSGGDASGTGGSASYSIGQIDNTNQSGTSGSINEGVQQPYEFFEFVGLDEHSLITTSLFPNPTNDFIVLKLESMLSDLTYIMYDQKGSIVREASIIDTETQINVQELAPGDYHMVISQEAQQIESIKIIKY
ncbi:MAG: T9SS type A sorting domain-containing protein [Crocinitomicaceae bacterium]|nr:T9SS type A sorting domain-containing protein [Crocinitomicaceae bacterium]